MFSRVLPILCSLMVVSQGYALEKLTTIDEAMRQVAGTQKAIMVSFIGSDWCQPCIDLRNTVFNSSEFEKIAKKNLVLVELDFPKSGLAEEQASYNKKMAKHYSIMAHPSVLLMDQRGSIFWKRVGYGEKKEYLHDIKSALSNKETILGNLAQAEKMSGLEKARYLKAAYDAMSPDLKENQNHIFQEILNLDKEDVLGLKQLTQEEAALKAFLNDRVLPLIKDSRYDQAISLLENYLSTKELSPATKQNIYQFIARAHLKRNDTTAAINSLEESIKIAPSSSTATVAREVLKDLKKKSS